MPTAVDHVYTSFVNVTDPRVDRGANHDLLEMIFIALTATLCGANGWCDVERFAKGKEAWFRKYLKLDHGIPSHDTFSRVFARLDTVEFLLAMHQWIDRFAGSLKGKGIAIDGKTLRGSFDAAAGQSPLHTLTAFATTTRLCLRQSFVDGKSNEIPAVPRLLQLMELEGAIVTVDALHCQIATVDAILAKGADYVVTVKRNQPSLHDALFQLFDGLGQDDFRDPRLRKHVSTERNRNRTEERIYYALPAPKTVDFQRWPGIRSVGMVYRHRQVDGQQQDETVFFISSMRPAVKRLSELIRGHWTIENSLHHVLDVTFDEDASRIRKGSLPDITSAFRRMALNVLKQDTTVKDTIRGKRLRAGWDERVLDRLFAGFRGL